ncbi:MAG: hypothetical protein ABIP27_17125 [Flavobacterium circumlabens]|uniref:Bacteriocin n=1 Tax=Flavobacterium circumlabens TaxID=2133765 RepID=A0A4Y7UH55_9FLAO|nr:hypothetical protein [Flavobacterium circumlabens]TCN59943.1 hypothetical protein EV142_102563 [Flavobacterium circumlabens]TEB45189.1 hypothetical protein D0809_08445 [Flavobacterium circumlabens]
MKKLELNQMESLSGGTNKRNCFLLGFFAVASLGLGAFASIGAAAAVGISAGAGVTGMASNCF